jgi:membrane protein implicated in regulation of membrane protease activity
MERRTSLRRGGLTLLFALTLVAAVSQATSVLGPTPDVASLVLFVAFSIASVVLLWQLFDQDRPA